ncbi:MAG: hypothetical protein M3R02_18240 [Chloroflexota bacterium]|nr:hypothetical protein [Chloroflexota bacterium]
MMFALLVGSCAAVGVAVRRLDPHHADPRRTALMAFGYMLLVWLIAALFAWLS